MKWEVITEEELNANKGGEAGKDNPDVKPSESGGFTNDPKDLGLDLSDSDNDEDERKDIDIDSEEGGRLSAGEGDSRMSDSMSTTLDRTMERKSSPAAVGPTQFSRDMFSSPQNPGINTHFKFWAPFFSSFGYSFPSFVYPFSSSVYPFSSFGYGTHI